jgi:hypothetical protein
MGLLARLRGSPAVHAKATTHTTISEAVNVTVPPAHAPAVQHKLERWAQDKGWAALVTATGDGENVKLSLTHDERMPGDPPDLDARKLGGEVQKLVREALNEN